ncbi:MAG: LytTR family transcriptional regulator DNA-binding domain-containing protein [Prevotellaceae bacterium]|jgi:DNA-binding LytR/AlgR family response regulator|nr:LytTR family transcriptional regulator DNA-binding domain-containing protein [Prevotellaceae bacterium]
MYLVFSSLIIFTGVQVVVISRIVMYYFGKKHNIGMGAYLLWVLLEVFFMALFYTFYTSYVNPERDYMSTFRESLINTSLVLLLPYSVLHLYFAYKDKDNKLKQIEELLADTMPTQSIYSFHDEKGELHLSITKENLLYIASADNYVEIWYLNKETPTKLIVRNSLKTIEKNLGNSHVVRSHRSYIVNLEAVKVIRRQKDGIYMDFGIEHIPDIPVSELYKAKITHWFTKHSTQ